jgi:RNA polymerase sigma-70 factor, ECF subfamily
VPSEALDVPDDIELIRQIRLGDEAAFRVLVDREGRYLYGIAHALTGNAADAEDVVQETFAGAVSGRFRGEASLRTWLVQILVRRVGMLHRSRRRKGPHQSLDSGAADCPTEETSTPPETAGTEARLDLSTMLASLSAEHRTVIVLRELRGLTYQEMAAALGVPVGTVESRLHRAREEMRKRFKGYL